jgi:DNA-binding CsgD family transcriptional regulator
MNTTTQNKLSFELLINSFAFDCWSVDTEMRYIYQNDKSIENWGSVTGKTIDELDIDKQTKTIWKQQLKKVFAGEIITTEYAVEEQAKHFNSIITPLQQNGTIIGALGATMDITPYKENEEKLTHRKKELERLNTALHVLLEKREKDKAELEQNLVKNIQTELLPLTARLKKMNADKNCIDIINTIETKLRQIQLVSSDNLSTILSHTELQVAYLIREGKASKTIADILNISKSTVDSHRDSIRHKLGLKNTSKNLKEIL